MTDREGEDRGVRRMSIFPGWFAVVVVGCGARSGLDSTGGAGGVATRSPTSGGGASSSFSSSATTSSSTGTAPLFKVLVAGGAIDGGTILAKTEVYDPGKEIWA